MCQFTHCYQEEVGHLEPRFQGEGGRPWGIFFGFYKTRDILISDSAMCRLLRQYRHVTDGQTDGIAVASTALAINNNNNKWSKKLSVP